MANLLDRASVVLTPTAYNNGEALCIKPDDASGDFQFSRNSAATRVNAQGLVENVQSLSSNLVTNGDFATDSNWVKGTGTTISGGSANFVNADGVSLYQSIGTQSGFVKITFNVTDYTSGTLNVYSGGNQSVGIINVSANALGTYTAYVDRNGGNVNIIFGSSDNFIGSIDNVSVKEISTDTNLPRINYESFSYDGSGNVVPDSGCGSWFWEPQTTQLLPYSEDYSQSSWSKGSDISIESGYLAPDGNNTAYKVTKTGGGAPLLSSNQSLITTTTRSIYARTVSGTGKISLLSYFGNSNNLFDVTEQWQRFEVNVAIATGASNLYAVDFRNLSTTLSEVIIWGANATNDQDYATSYIPSNGSSVTRNQDLCNNGGSLASINSTSGVLYAEIAALTKINPSGNITLSDGTGNNRIYIYYLIDNSISVIYNVNSTGASINNFSLANITDQTKIAVRWGNSNVSVWINGASVLSNTTSNFLPNTLNVFSFAKPSGGVPFEGKTKAVAVWKEALSDQELTELTTI